MKPASMRTSLTRSVQAPASTLSRRSLLKGAAGSSACLALPAIWQEGMGGGALKLPAGFSARCVSTTEAAPWQTTELTDPGWHWDTLDLAVSEKPVQAALQGFGGCFNELGWMSLQKLAQKDRDVVLDELFKPGVGANLSFCRMPIGGERLCARMVLVR